MTETNTPTRLYKDRQEVLHAASCARDAALAWVADLVGAREGKGVGAALTAFDRLQERVERMQDRIEGTNTSGGDVYIVPPWSPWAEQQGEDAGTDTDADAD